MQKIICLFLIISVFCSACVKGSGNYFAERYTETVRKYFVEYAFDDTQHSVGKWPKKQVTYSVKNFPLNHQIFIIRSFEGLSKLKNLPVFKLVKQDADITLHLYDSELAFAERHKMKETLRGFTAFGKDGQGYFTDVSIGINPNQEDQDLQISIHHELMHALGFLAHPVTELSESTVLGIRYLSKFDAKNKISPILPQIDQRMLELLYEDSLPLLASKAKVENLLGMD